MHIKTIASAATLVLALGLSGATFAQDAAAGATTTVNGLTVTAIDLPRVQAYCDQLASGITPDEPTDQSALPGNDSANGAVGTNTSTEGNTDKDDSDPTIDLGKVTIEGCAEAGLAAAPAAK